MQTATWSRAGSARGLCAVLGTAVVLLAAGPARADQPAVPPAPPAETAAPAPAPADPIAPPAASDPTATAPAATAPAATAPADAPTLTPEPPVVPAPALEAPATPPPPPARPFYRRDWFWGAVGVVVLTAAIVLVATSGSDPQAPATTLGNMRAF